MVYGEIKIYRSNVKTLFSLKKLSNEANCFGVWLNFRRVTFSPVCLFTDNAGVIVNNKGEMKGKCVYIHARAHKNGQLE